MRLAIKKIKIVEKCRLHRFSNNAFATPDLMNKLIEVPFRTSLKIEESFWIECPDQDYLIQLVQPIDSVPDGQSPNLFNLLVPRFTLKQSYHFFYNRIGVKST